MAIVGSLLELVGATSVLRLRRVVPEGHATVWAKLELQNPSGSAQDRVARALLDAAERDHGLVPGGTVVEASSGNTAVALSQLCAARGYKLVVTMPASMSLERRAILRAHGVELVLTPDDTQMEGAVARARALALERPGAVFLGQFDHPAAVEAHRAGTGAELLDALGVPDAVVAGVGSGATLTGVARALRARGASTRVVAVEPAGCAVLAGGARGPTKIQGVGVGFVPGNYDRALVDQVIAVGDREAWAMRGRLAREEGLLAGISAGAAVVAALEVARELGPERTVAVIVDDTGERYFSLETFFAEPGA